MAAVTSQLGQQRLCHLFRADIRTTALSNLCGKMQNIEFSDIWKTGSGIDIDLAGAVEPFAPFASYQYHTGMFGSQAQIGTGKSASHQAILMRRSFINDAGRADFRIEENGSDRRSWAIYRTGTAWRGG
ncbi:MAG: hypothetical protein R2845_15615 [Thermomicrobiales bacterium]